MLDSIRDKAQSFGIKIIFGIIILVFIFWGVGGLTVPSVGSVASVNGKEIPSKDFIRVFSRVMESQRSRNPSFGSDKAVVDLMKQQVLAGMVANELWQQEAGRLGLFVPPQELRDSIARIGLFQDNTGRFDNEKYKSILESQGVTRGQFEAGERQTLLTDKLQQYITMSVMPSEEEARNFYFFRMEKRKAQYVLFSRDDYAKKAEVADADIADYYEKHKEEFRVPAQVDISWVAVTPDSLAKNYPVSEDEVAAYYQERKEQYSTPEQYRFRHIFLAAPPPGSLEEGAKDRVAAAEALMEEIGKQLKSGTSFAALAEKHSNDEQSRAQGGALEPMTLEEIALPEYREALSSLQAGEVSAPLRTVFGLHLVKLEEKKPAQVTPLAKVKDEIKAVLAKNKAEQEFNAVHKAVEDSLDVGASLAVLEKEFKVKAQRTGLVAEEKAMEILGLHSDAKSMFLDALLGFGGKQPQTPGTTNATEGAVSANATQRQAAGPTMIPVPLNIVDGVALVAVHETRPSAIPPLEVLKAGIKDTLQNQAASTLAHKAATEALASFSGKDLPPAFKGKGRDTGFFSRTDPRLEPFGTLPSLSQALLSADGDTWLASVYDCPEGSLIVRVSEVMPVTNEEWEANKEQSVNGYTQYMRGNAMQMFTRSLQNRADIRQFNDVLEQIILR